MKDELNKEKLRTAQGKDRISEFEDKREEQGQSNKGKDKIVKRYRWELQDIYDIWKGQIYGYRYKRTTSV